MPPNGYTTITLSDGLAAKLTRTMVRRDCSSYAKVVKHVADATLVQEDELTMRGLVQLLSERKTRWTKLF